MQGGITTNFGTTNDVPVPGDYNGDGKTDIAVFRPSNGVWFVQGGITAVWGAPTDIALPLPTPIRWRSIRDPAPPSGGLRLAARSIAVLSLMATAWLLWAVPAQAEPGRLSAGM